MSVSVLVPLDGSAVAEHALPVAVAIARRSGGTVHLCRICAPAQAARPLPAAATLELARRRVRAAAYLRSIARRLSAAFGIRVRQAVRVGPTAESILREAELVGVELIVMTTHGAGETGPRWVGSTADEVVHRADCGVLLLTGRSAGVEWKHDGFARILVPVEGALDPVSILEGTAHLWPEVGATYCLLSQAGAGETGELSAEAPELLRAAEDFIHLHGARTVPAPTSGYAPAPAVMHAAREFAADLVALAFPARFGTAAEALTPLAERLVRMAPFPLLLHRPSVRRPLDLPGLALPAADGEPRADAVP